MRLGDWVLKRGGYGEGLQLAHLFHWPAQLLCSQGMHAGAGGWDPGISWGKEGWK